jgi:hypothetical protein
MNTLQAEKINVQKSFIVVGNSFLNGTTFVSDVVVRGLVDGVDISKLQQQSVAQFFEAASTLASVEAKICTSQTFGLLLTYLLLFFYFFA